MSNERIEQNLRQFDEMERRQFEGQKALADIKAGIYQAAKMAALKTPGAPESSPQHPEGGKVSRGPSL